MHARLYGLSHHKLLSRYKPRRPAGWLLFLLGLLLVGCGTQATSSGATVEPTHTTPLTASATTSSQPTATTPPSPTKQVTIDLDTIPSVDTSKHTVPLEEIYFDTFRRTNRVVPLSEASTDLIASLRDAIPPIYQPKFVPAAEADAWLDSKDIVVGYADGDHAYAYPIKIMNWHEMVSHQVNSRPILATY